MNLQPLNICMSYQGTLNLMEKLSEDHDIEVQFWRDEMKDAFSEDGENCELFDIKKFLG